MAIMVPSFPYGFTPASREDEVFECLQNKLSDDYYVFHSFKLADLKNGTWKEKEIDFVIYNKAKGRSNKDSYPLIPFLAVGVMAAFFI